MRALAQPLQQAQRGIAIGHKAFCALIGADGVDRHRTDATVHPLGVEPRLGQALLQLFAFRKGQGAIATRPIPLNFCAAFQTIAQVANKLMQKPFVAKNPFYGCPIK